MLKFGEDVVVKVQKFGVQVVIIVDLYTMFVLIWLLEFMLLNMDKDALIDIVVEMYQVMIDECDFVKEVSYFEGFCCFLLECGIIMVVVSKFYVQVLLGRVLMMECFYGCVLIDIQVLVCYGVDFVVVLFEVLNVWFVSFIGCDFFYVDLYSGNMFLFEDGCVGFIDFGMVGCVSFDVWQVVFGLFVGLGEADYWLVVEFMLKVGMICVNISVEAFVWDIEWVFQVMEVVDLIELGVWGGNDGINDVVNSLGEVVCNYGICFLCLFILLLKQFLYFDCYVQIMDLGVDLFCDDWVIMNF